MKKHILILAMIISLPLAGIVQAAEVDKSQTPDKPIAPAQVPTKPAQVPTKPAQVPTKPVKAPVKPVKAPVKGEMVSSKVEQFLQEIDRARSLEDVGRAFKEGNFSQAERRQLEQEVKNQPYSSKLRSLANQAKASARAKRAKTVKQRQQAQVQEQEQELRRLNQQVLARWQSLKPKVRTREQVLMHLDRSEWTLVTAVGHPVIAEALRKHQPRIQSFTPQPVVAGQDLTILGENFGTTRGTAFLHIEGLRTMLSIGRWTETSVVVTIPSSVQVIVGETEKEGRILIEKAEEGVGGAGIGTIRIAPDISRLIPEITKITSSSPLGGTPRIRPGWTLVIEGRNFLETSSGTVNFTLLDDGVTHPGTIKGWADTAIYVELRDDIEGVRIQDCEVEVKNHLDQRTTRTISFLPIIEFHTLSEHHSIDCSLIFWGYKYTATDHNFELRNQWRVVNAQCDWWGEGLGAGCNVIEEPASGSTNPRCEIEYWADLYSYVSADNEVTISGPKGLPYR